MCARQKPGNIDLPFDNTLPGLDLQSILPGIYREDRAKEVAASGPVQSLLLVLAELIFHGKEVPSPCLQARSNRRVSFFVCEKLQFDLMRCLLNGDSLYGTKDRARAKLLPLFLVLNTSLERVSYFRLNHEANWDQVGKALTYIPIDLEHICQVISGIEVTMEGNAFSTALLFDKLPYAGYQGDLDAIQARVKWMMTCLQNFTQQERKAHSEMRSSRLVHFLGSNCRCIHSKEMVDGVVQLSLSDAYVSKHACGGLCSQEKR